MWLLALAALGAARACLDEASEGRWADLRIPRCLGRGGPRVPGCVRCSEADEGACAACAGDLVPDPAGAACVLPCQLREPLCASCELRAPGSCLRCAGNRVLRGGACVDCGELYADPGRNLCVRTCGEAVPGCAVCSRGEPGRCERCASGEAPGPGGCLAAGAAEPAPGRPGLAAALFALAALAGAAAAVLVALALRAGPEGAPGPKARAGRPGRAGQTGRAASRRVGGGSASFL